MIEEFEKRFELEKQIDLYMTASPTAYTKTCLAEIEELSSFTWPQLATKIKFGEYRVRIMGSARMTFHVVAQPAHKSSFSFFSFMAIAILVLSLGLAIFVKWWLIFLALLSPVMFAAARAAYSEAILGAANTSGKAFSFLFSRGVICLLGEQRVVVHNINQPE